MAMPWPQKHISAESCLACSLLFQSAQTQLSLSFMDAFCPYHRLMSWERSKIVLHHLVVFKSTWTSLYALSSINVEGVGWPELQQLR